MCDVGGGDQTSTPATKCLVFMTNAVNDRFKMTLGHFFVDNLTGKGILPIYLSLSVYE